MLVERNERGSSCRRSLFAFHSGMHYAFLPMFLTLSACLSMLSVLSHFSGCDLSHFVITL